MKSLVVTVISLALVLAGCQTRAGKTDKKPGPEKQPVVAPDEENAADPADTEAPKANPAAEETSNDPAESVEPDSDLEGEDPGKLDLDVNPPPNPDEAANE